MRPLHKPGPKSKTRKASPKMRLQSDLGETDTSSSNENISFTSQNLTDYNLHSTSSFQHKRETRRSCRRTATATFRNVETTSSVRSPRAQERTLQPVSTSSVPGTSRASARKRRKQSFPVRNDLKKVLKSTGFMIPRACFARLTREIMMGLSSDVTHITASALEALQVATEKYMENRFEDAYLLALHARRVTLLLRDMQLITYMLGRHNL